MIFNQLPDSGAWLVDFAPIEDDRGFFGRGWCIGESAARQLVAKLTQTSLTHNHRRGILRGILYQAEVKLVRFTRCGAYVVNFNSQTRSPTYLRLAAVPLSAGNRRAMYVTQGRAQSYQTLADDIEMLYQMSEAYVMHAARGVRSDDPAFGIHWPMAVTVISDADRCWLDRPSHRPSLTNACLAADASRA